MGKVISIGETLIDFMPNDDNGYTLSPGGAPANVAACVAALGGNAQLITKIGADFFGDYLINILRKTEINISSVMKTSKANTGLAFVSHKPNGERSFLFYRNPSADMLLDESEIDETWFNKKDILHFCSVDLIDAPVRLAHNKAIEYAKKNGCLICFDPNIRLALWNDHDDYKKVVNKYIDEANILKISDEELQFITNIQNETEAIESLLRRVDILVYTKGSKGAEVYTKQYKLIHPGYEAKAIDTTGAGDSFIGAFLYKLNQNPDPLNSHLNEMKEALELANKVASMVVEKKGTIEIMPTYRAISDYSFKIK